MSVRDAVAAILSRHRDEDPVGRKVMNIENRPFAAEAKAMRDLDAAWLTTVEALTILKVVECTVGIANHDKSAIRHFIARSLSRGWPANAVELVNLLLRQPDRIRHAMKELPTELFGNPSVTADMVSKLTSGSNLLSDTLELAGKLRFDEAQTRVLIHQHTRRRDRNQTKEGSLDGLIAGVVQRSSAPECWRRVQQACIARSDFDDEPQDDLVQCLDCLPMRWRGTNPTFDLLGGTPEVRSAWIARMMRFVQADDEMFDALLEGLLWHGAERADELMMMVASALCDTAQDEGRRALGKLSLHPSQGVVLRAEALLRRIADAPVEPDRPVPSGILDAARRLADLSDRHRGSPATWIGDRRVEMAIEAAVRDVCAKFVGSYEAHWREDEEPLTVKLLGDLRAALHQVETDVAGLVGRRPAVRRIGFTLRDRVVPKTEEGADGTIPGTEFAADICFVMTARRDGKVLTTRATLVQVKKLKMGAKGRWDPSFEIVQEQLKAISDQTASSFYVFIAPEEGGRSIPVIPARLIVDHLRRGGRTRRLHRDDVARTSRGFAKWLTYDLIGLWCGDPDVELLRKAAGERGRKPYRLIELDVTIASGKGD